MRSWDNTFISHNFQNMNRWNKILGYPCFHITICFDTGFKNISKGDVWSECLAHLHKMNLLLIMDYSSPIDIGLNQINKNWAGFLKLHLKHPLKDWLTLLRGNVILWMELEGGERVISKVEKDFELVTKAQNLRLHIQCLNTTVYTEWLN